MTKTNKFLSLVPCREEHGAGRHDQAGACWEKVKYHQNQINCKVTWWAMGVNIKVIPGGHEHESQAVDELHPSQGVHPHEHQHSVQHRHWDKPGREYDDLDGRQ